MARRYEQAEVLVALWALGSQRDMMPTSHGILDRALEAMRPRLPGPLAELTFGATSVGLRSFELPDILLAAQEAMLTSEPNPTYLSTMVTISPDQAAEIVVEHGLGVDQARSLGEELHEKVRAFKDKRWQSRAVA